MTTVVQKSNFKFNLSVKASDVQLSLFLYMICSPNIRLIEYFQIEWYFK